MKKPIHKQRTTLAGGSSIVLSLAALLLNSPEIQEALTNLALAGIGAAFVYMRQTLNKD